MSDSAKPVSGEHLEILGKQAATIYSSGVASTLNEAVIETVKHAGLSAEQVKRVIEFANTDAYLTEFKKEGAHRVVHFHGGPANPSDILKDLNAGGEASTFFRGSSDYHNPPQARSKMASMDKTASVSAESDILDTFFQRYTESPSYPEVNPFREVIEFREKLAQEFDALTTELNDLEMHYEDLGEQVYGQIKQASLSGTPLGDVIRIWGAAVPSSEHIKIAFENLTPRLLNEGVIHSKDLTSSIAKTAGVGLVNIDHPMFTSFKAYCAVLEKLAEVRSVRTDVRQGLAELDSFLAKEAKGIIPKAFDTAKKFAPKVGNKIRGAAAHVLGEEGAKLVGDAAQTATHYAPHAAVLVGANEARRHLKYSPTWNSFQSVANPHSDQYRQREYELAQRGGYA